MSELTNARIEGNDFRRGLLTTVSAMALLASVGAVNQVKAADGDSTPPFWIELGGQFAQQKNDQDAFAPPFTLPAPRPPYIIVSPADVEKVSPSSWDGTAKIAYEPVGTGWVFSAAVLYGKSNRSKSAHQQTVQGSHGSFGLFDAYQIINARNSESHAILDFQAGKDVGLGVFGSGGNSTFSLGVRYVRFDSRSDVNIQSQPTNVNSYGYYHIFRADFVAERKFTGIGPSLAWDGSANLIGKPTAGNITFDWGVNGAILFGRQRVNAHHQTTDNYKHGFYYLSIAQTHASPSRNKQVTVPSLGGFAGISLRFLNAKVSLGYRADMFFGAMDGGIDVAHKENVGFFGPFATIGVGMGG